MEKLLTFLQTIFTLARDQKQALEELKEVRQDLTELTLALARLAAKIELIQQEDYKEREKLEMKLQIEMLKFEKHLPKRATAKGKVKPQARITSNMRDPESGG